MLARNTLRISARLINTSSRAAAHALEPNHPAAKKAIEAAGNSFASFAEYRKSAIYHGPLKKNFILKSNGEMKPVAEEERAIFAKAARNSAYRE
jgi:hypothetical protein